MIIIFWKRIKVFNINYLSNHDKLMITLVYLIDETFNNFYKF